MTLQSTRRVPTYTHRVRAQHLAPLKWCDKGGGQGEALEKCPHVTFALRVWRVHWMRHALCAAPHSLGCRSLRSVHWSEQARGVVPTVQILPHTVNRGSGSNRCTPRVPDPGFAADSCQRDNGEI